MQQLLALCFLFLIFSSPVYAACSSPAGIEGEVEFNTTTDHYELCDDTNWVKMFKDKSPVPFAHYTFDESSGTTAADSISGYDGTTINTPTWQTAGGQIGGAIEFSAASNERIDVGGIGTVGTMSYTFWVYQASRGSGYVAVLARLTSVGVWFANPPNADEIRIFDMGGSERLYSGTIPLTTWTHIAITDDGTTSRIYVNGVEQDNDTNRVAFPIETIGDAGGTYPFDGRLDDLRLYDKALTAAEVADLYNESANMDYTCSKEEALDYSTSGKFFKLCNNSQWITFRKGATGAACSSDGSMAYFTADKLINIVTVQTGLK